MCALLPLALGCFPYRFSGLRGTEGLAKNREEGFYFFRHPEPNRQRCDVATRWSFFLPRGVCFFLLLFLYIFRFFCAVLVGRCCCCFAVSSIRFALVSCPSCFIQKAQTYTHTQPQPSSVFSTPKSTLRWPTVGWGGSFPVYVSPRNWSLRLVLRFCRAMIRNQNNKRKGKQNQRKKRGVGVGVGVERERGRVLDWRVPTVATLDGIHTHTVRGMSPRKRRWLVGGTCAVRVQSTKHTQRPLKGGIRGGGNGGEKMRFNFRSYR